MPKKLLKYTKRGHQILTLIKIYSKSPSHVFQAQSIFHITAINNFHLKIIIIIFPLVREVEHDSEQSLQNVDTVRSPPLTSLP